MAKHGLDISDGLVISIKKGLTKITKCILEFSPECREMDLSGVVIEGGDPMKLLLREYGFDK